jgi:spore germination cell wall hydrolase CwlJ-like protein
MSWKGIRQRIGWVWVIMMFMPGAACPEPGAEQAKAKAEVLEARVEDHVPPGPGETLSRGEAQAVDPAGAAPLEDPIACLARTIYWEAKGEGEEGMRAIAAVVLNRLGTPGFPDTVCGVVKEGQSQRRCQFSWWCDGRPDEVQDPSAYASARDVARRALNREIGDPTGGALYFHHRGVNPEWASAYTRTAEIGAHRFYVPADGRAR